MDAVVLRVRDRQLIKIAVQTAYIEQPRTAGQLPHPELIRAIVEACWEPQQVTSKVAFGAITRAVGKLLKLLQKAPRVLNRILEVLQIEDWSEMSWTERARALGDKLRELVTAGKKALGKALRHAVTAFPLNLFFVEHNKMPGLTDLMNRLMARVPWLQKALSHVNSGAIKLDTFLKKYLPTLSRGLYAAVFIWVWLNVAEISWDVQSILDGFTGRISLSDLLGSLPESGLGFVAASFGLGYGALPYALIARLIWLVAQRYLTYVPGKGFQVHWDRFGVEERPELVPA